ncbi:DMT family transporter [Brevibacillus dissolubilis]|uniref:DMT family transporter n=1 Tax=Brevibacillus dissolubilis TaxID=1844116 RepID=UPI0011167DAA|nr:DMT family transporter [Brevibacillus dissolubilis]
MEKPLIPPYLALLIGVLAISTSAIFVKLASAPASVIAAYRLVFTVLLMLPMLFWQKGVFSEIGSMNRKQWWLSIWSGIFLASHFVLWFESLNYTSINSSTVLVTLQPLFSFVGGYFFFGERLSKLALLGGVIAIGGSFIIGWGDFQIGGMALFGDILALLAALMVTLYWLIGQYMRQYISSTPYTLVVYSVSSITLVLYVLVMGHSLVGYPAMDWLWFFALALFPTLLGHSIFNWIIKWLNTTTVSMGILGEPIGTAILAYLIFGELVTVPQWIGGAVILFGIYLFIRYNKVQATAKGAATDASTESAERLA